MEKNYYLGLDIGTNSVGYAVIDKNYNVLKYKKRSIWGSRIFDEAQTAEIRRTYRTNRRLKFRRRWRIKILQELFAEEISKVDEGFYQRLKESALWFDDRLNGNYNTLFVDDNYKDSDYYREYPTIYHLKKALITENRKFDIRLIYLAIHHFMKKRGHFLFLGEIQNFLNFDNTFSEFISVISDEMNIFIECDDINRLEKILKDKNKSKSEKEKAIGAILYCDIKGQKNQLKQIIKGICGLTINIKNLFDDDELADIEKTKISFANDNYEELRSSLESDLNERVKVLDILKTVYDWSIISDLISNGEFKGKTYISIAKVNSYEKHQEDLKKLKKILRKVGTKEYKSIFKDDNKTSYSAYLGKAKLDDKKKNIKKCSEEDFYKNIKKLIKTSPIAKEEKEALEILEDIENENFMPLQVNKENGTIPYQIHLVELKEILKNAEKDYPFLSKIDKEGLTITDKIIKTFTFKIPYYVGPLNTNNSENAWAVRQEEGKIYPWNAEKKIDFGESSERFIRRMTNKCTYLYGEDVLPKNSLLYSDYMVLNEINNIKLGTKPISLELKEGIFTELFQNKNKVSLSDIKKYLESEGVDLKEFPITGIDEKINSSLSSYYDFKKIFGEDIKREDTKKMIEDIILWITIYPDEKVLLEEKIKSQYLEKIDKNKMKKILNLKYTGWGRLSASFLKELEGVNTETGEVFKIIEALRNTNFNLMELLSKRFTFQDEVLKANMVKEKNLFPITYENIMKDLPLSPAVKRSAWQAIQITEEIKKVMKSAPKKIFIEMSRGEAEKKRTSSRKDRLIQLYKNIKDSERDWVDEIKAQDESKFRSLKLYLYYTQMGRCMYSGEPIDLNEIFDTTIYDRDHIYPRSLTKDDSLDNLVLVKKIINSKVKSNRLVPPEIQFKMKSFWNLLRKNGLITAEKYSRLNRKRELTTEELAGFINRQMVETRQSIKQVYQILKDINSETEIVSVKANLVSDFRKEIDRVKVRSLNDLHHAKDAYLCAVVGNVYNEKFTKNPYSWVKRKLSTEKAPYNLSLLFKRDLIRNGEYIWKMGKDGTENTIKNQIDKNDILYTRYATRNKSGQNGGFFDQNIVNNTENPSVPIKKGMDVKKYGGYKTITASHFALIEHEDKKGKKLRGIYPVPLYKLKEFEKDLSIYEKYCMERYELINPKVLIPVIKKDTLFIINGFPMHLRGIGGKQISFQGAVQLYLDYEQEKYLKRIEKFIDRKKINDKLLIKEADGITKEKNIKLFEMLLEKLEFSIYKNRPNNQIKLLKESIIKFKELGIEQQVLVLDEILWLFRCKAKTTMNIKCLGGSEGSGNLTKNQKFIKKEKVYIVHQSVTGIFEKKVDIFEI